MYVQAGLSCICSFNVEHLRCRECLPYFCGKNRRGGCLHIFRQKNRRTKDSYKGQMYIQASLVFICLLNICTCGAVSPTLLLWQEQREMPTTFCFLKNAVLALQILCMMGMWLYRRKLAYAWTDGWASSAFLCSFVLMS